LPDSVGSALHPHLIVGCGKEGKIYLIDRDNMGHYNAANDNQIVQSIPGAVGGTWSSPAYFNNFIYYLGSGDVLKAFRIANGAITTAPASRSGTSFGFPGATPSVSASGTNNGIVWVIQADAYGSGGPAVLRAYNATNVAQYYKDLGEKVTIEVVTFGPGLHMLRDDTSPVKARIKAITESTPAISFKACGNTQENMHKAENKEIPIIPEATVVKSGVVRVMELQEQGWTYVKP